MKSLKTDVHFNDTTLEALSRQEDKSDNLNVQTASTQTLRDIVFGSLFFKAECSRVNSLENVKGIL